MKRLLISLLFLLTLTASALATDVNIGPSTIPGFNATNLPPDVTVTPVSVVNGSPNATCASCFRQQWVGLGGFRITIQGVPYTVAYVTSRSSLTLTTNYAAGDNPSATILWYKYVELRIYADSSFQPAGKTYIVQPGAPGSGAWHRRVAASVVNELGVNNLYIPQLTLDATTNSLTNQAARYTAAFYRPEGSLIQFYDCFESFLLAPTGATTWPDICMFNQRQVIVQDDSTYTKTQIDAMRTGCTVGQGLFYAATGLKPACLNFGSGLSLAGDTLTAVAPSGYTTVLNNGSPLTQRNNLNFVAPAFIASDNGGAVRTDVAADSDLNALASNATNGLWARTGAGTGAARTITGTTNRIVVTNGDGVSGNPTLDVGSTVATSGNALSFFAATTSAQLAGVISDETGSGLLVFGTSPTIATPTISNGILSSPRISTAIFDLSGNELIGLTSLASAVNEINVSNAATATAPAIATTGGDADINLNFNLKGLGGAILNGAFLSINSNVPQLFFNDLDNSKSMNITLSNTTWNWNNGTLASTPLSMNTATDVFTFSQIPLLPGSNPTTANQAVRKQYVDDRTTAFSLSFGIADPSTPTVGGVIPGTVTWVCPDGQSVTITKVSVVWQSGSHTLNGSVSFQLQKRTAASSWVTSTNFGTVTLDNTNNTQFNVYTNDISDEPLVAGDTLIMFISARANTVTERDVTVVARGTQKLIP